MTHVIKLVIYLGGIVWKNVIGQIYGFTYKSF